MSNVIGPSFSVSLCVYFGVSRISSINPFSSSRVACRFPPRWSLREGPWADRQGGQGQPGWRGPSCRDCGVHPAGLCFSHSRLLDPLTIPHSVTPFSLWSSGLARNGFTLTVSKQSMGVCTPHFDPYCDPAPVPSLVGLENSYSSSYSPVPISSLIPCPPQTPRVAPFPKCPCH